MLASITRKTRITVALLSAAGSLMTGVVAGTVSAAAEPAPESGRAGRAADQPECNGPHIDNNWHEGPRAQVACTGVVYRIEATYCAVHCVTEVGPWKTNWEWSTLIFPHGGSITSAQIRVH